MRQLTHGSLFAGIGGFDRGFHEAGMRTLWMAEKEPFCRAVLRTNFPGVQIFDDVRHITRDTAAVDVVSAGFPCQDLSVAGKRAGLEGSRSGLFWEVVRILGELRPAWFVLENVPGLFSSGEGRDFGIVLNALDELGYGLAWRVLDSQFFGVAQRRRRVFIVGCFGKPCPEEVLFEPESGAGDITEGREERAGTPDGITYCARVSGALKTRDAKGTRCDIDEPTFVAASFRASDGHHGFSSPRGDGSDNLVCGPLGGSSRSGGYQPNAEQAADGFLQVTTPSLTSNGDQHKGFRNGDGLVCGRRREDDFNLAVGYATSGFADFKEQLGTLRAEGGDVGPGSEMLAVDECTAPDADRVRDFASLPEGMDSARYRALGNAVTSSVAKWIGKRIIEADKNGGTLGYER